MLFGWDHIKKAISVSMLILLLLVHSIKLLHTHSFPAYINSVSEKLKVSNQALFSVLEKNQPDCEICHYLIAKDADDSFKQDLPEQLIALQIFNSPLLFNTSFVHQFAIESRGPPTIV